MRGRFNNSVATFVSFKLIHVLVLGVLLKYISLFTCDTRIIFSSFTGGWSWGLASLSLTNSSSSCRKMLTHPNARVLRAEEGGLTTLPNPLLDGKQAADLGTARWVQLALPSRAEGRWHRGGWSPGLNTQDFQAGYSPAWLRHWNYLMDTIFIIITLMHHCGPTVLYCKKVTQAKHGPSICNYIHCSSKRRQLAECIPQKAIGGGQSSGVTFPFSSLLPEN